MRTLLVFLTLIVFASSCAPQPNNSIATDLSSDLEAIRVRDRVFVLLKKNENLHPCGWGGGMHGTKKFQMLYCGFQYNKEIDIEEARRLLLTAGNLFLREVNQDEKIRPFLGHHPFKPENIELDIFLKNSDGAELESEKLHVISMRRGELEYMKHDSTTRFLKTLHSETYEEAMSKLNASPMPPPQIAMR